MPRVGRANNMFYKNKRTTNLIITISERKNTIVSTHETLSLSDLHLITNTTYINEYHKHDANKHMVSNVIIRPVVYDSLIIAKAKLIT